MHLGELLYRVAQRRVTLRCGPSGRLHYAPRDALGTELLVELRRQKGAVIRALREDEELRRTGIIQSERQVFDLAREIVDIEEDRGDDNGARDVVGY